MTNAEKFFQVFGYLPEMDNKHMKVCDMMMCGDTDCDECKYFRKHSWDDEYKEPNNRTIFYAGGRVIEHDTTGGT